MILKVRRKIAGASSSEQDELDDVFDDDFLVIIVIVYDAGDEFESKMEDLRCLQQ